MTGNQASRSETIDSRYGRAVSVGVDIGSINSNVVACWVEHGKLVRKKVVFDSYVKLGVPEIYSDLDGDSADEAGLVTLNDGRTYTIGQKTEQGLVVGEKRCYSGGRTALLYHALLMLGVTEKDILIIAAGVPTELAYQKDGFGRNEPNTTFLKKVADSFRLLPHKVLSVDVYPEVAPASFVYFAEYEDIDNWGKMQKDRLNEGEVTLFADDGGDTLDKQSVVVVRDEKQNILKPQVIRSTCISYPGHGVKGMHNILNQSICTAFVEQGQKVGGGTLNQYQLDAALAGMVAINGIPIETKTFIADAIEKQAARIQNTLVTSTNEQQIDNYAFSGGGFAGVFKPYVTSWFENTTLLDGWAAAKGLLTLATRQALMMAHKQKPMQKPTFTQALINLGKCNGKT